jgi:Uma2 family endonuclease
MNIHRPPIGSARPARFTAESYVDSRQLLNQLFFKTELRDGVIFEMPADGPVTTRWNSAISRWLFENLSREWVITTDKTLVLDEDWAPTPDHYIFPAYLMEENVRGVDVNLLIEVSDKTLSYDLGEKAAAYASHGVREFWVADVNAKCLHVHLLGADGTYGAPRIIAFEQQITASLIPHLTLCLADLPRIS